MTRVLSQTVALPSPVAIVGISVRFAMANLKQSPGKGRPRRNPVDVLFTKIWFKAVEHGTGLTSPDAIERLIRPRRSTRKNGRQVRSRTWHNYQAGRHVATPVDGIHPVDLAEQVCPGTARFFYSPLKTLLRRDTVCVDWIHRQLTRLPSPVATLLLHRPSEALDGIPLAFLNPFNDQQAKQLAAVGGLHALEAAVLLIKLGELTASPELRRLAREAYIRTQPSVRGDPTLAARADELFELIDDAFPRWLHLRPDFRLELMSLSRIRGAPLSLSPEQILAEENSPTNILCLSRIALENLIIEARYRDAEESEAQ